MRAWGVGMAACAAAAGMVACSGGGDSSDAGSTTASKGASTGASSTRAAGSATSGSNSTKTSASKGTTSGAADAGSTTATGAATLSSVTMANVGRHGDTLLFTVKGADPAAQTTEVHVRLLDASSAPVIAFDTNWDGVADSAETRLHFDQSALGQKTFTQTITLPGLFANVPNVASAEVALSDAQGNLSPSMTATLSAQTVSAQGAACDPNEATSRCTAGLSCSGSPAQCQAGVAPTLTAVGYYGGTNAAEIFTGADPDEDLASITLHFLDNGGNPVSVDLGDGTPVSSTVLNTQSATGQTYAFENYPAPGFTTSVPRIAATPTDSFGRAGATVTASLGTQPVRASGQSCDPSGLTGCATGSACSPGVAGATNTCGTMANLQTAKCTAAPQAAASGVIAAWGLVQGASLWDPPSGCTFATEVNRPESLVTLKLAAAVNTLTISTATPETDFDTVLYVLPSCATTSAQALGCNDDTTGFSSTVTLTNVAAGTYVVVVDAAGPQGGHFGLTVATQ